MLSVIDPKIQEYKQSLKKVLQQLQQFTQRIQHDASATIVADLRDRIEEPFMFVIVGEVKSGKSSFINALLDDPDLCAVAPSPMTDSIQQILYGAVKRVEEVSPFFKRVYQPDEILRDIAIVDTPGTNTIIQHHQEITERFIPGSDLIVFVFEAKNPYRQSAWEFFDFIHHDWHKKIIFVLQQKDLLDETDLDVNMKGVSEHAIKKGIDAPLVFAVSAKKELQGERAESGFLPLKKYILDHVTGGKAQEHKLLSLSTTAATIISKLQSGLDERKLQLDADLNFREEVRQTLNDHGQRAKHQSDILIENLMSAYDRVQDSYEEDLRQGLSFFTVLRRSLGGIFSKTQSIKTWLEDFTERLRTDFGTGMQDKINERVLDLAESIQQMAHTIDLQIRNSKTILANDHELFSDIAQRRQNVLRELREAFEQFLKKTESFTTTHLVDPETTVGTNVAAGSGIAVVGVILAAVTNGMVFDITGGVLTALGFLTAGITLGFQKGKIIRRYKAEMERGRKSLELELKLELYAYVENLKSRMNAHFQKFDDLLRQETLELSLLNQDLTGIRSDLARIQEHVLKK